MADKGYTTEAKINTFLGKTITVGSANDYILAAQKLIEELTGRNFKADTDASERLFCGDGTQILTIDDCIEVSKVEVGSNFYGDSFTEIDAFVQGTNTTGYILEPINYVKEEVPIRQLVLRDRFFTEGLNNQKITAKWGWSAAVPADVSFAATVLAAGMYQYNRGGASGNAKAEKIGNYSITYNNEDGWSAYNKAMLVLDQYKKYSL